ncbi:MAG: hypothetical protein ACOCV1_04145 [Bacillota bacterium]
MKTILYIHNENRSKVYEVFHWKQLLNIFGVKFKPEYIFKARVYAKIVRIGNIHILINYFKPKYIEFSVPEIFNPYYNIRKEYNISFVDYSHALDLLRKEVKTIGQQKLLKLLKNESSLQKS